MGAILENPSMVVPLVSGTIGIVTVVSAILARLIRVRREAAYRQWTEQQEDLLRAGGPMFRLQVFRTHRLALAWAVTQGRLRVVEDHPWGWYVEVETRLICPQLGS